MSLISEIKKKKLWNLPSLLKMTFWNVLSLKSWSWKFPHFFENISEIDLSFFEFFRFSKKKKSRLLELRSFQVVFLEDFWDSFQNFTVFLFFFLQKFTFFFYLRWQMTRVTRRQNIQSVQHSLNALPILTKYACLNYLCCFYSTW